MFGRKTHCVVVVGAQWGDEGKGKIVDVLAERADLVVRYQGGANAGHTVHTGAGEFVLHQIPSGIIQGAVRSEERRVGKECRSRWSSDEYKRRRSERSC